MKPGKEIKMRDLVNFCETYNQIGFGKAELIELKSKFIVKLWNADYSENESMDIDFRRHYKSNIFYDYHPIIIAEFSKLNLTYNDYVVDFESFKADTCSCYSKKDEFTYNINIR